MKIDVTGRFWRVLSPNPVTLITSISKEGKPNVMTAAWTMPVSVEPPLVAISIGNKRYSHKLIEESGEFVINIPSSDMVNESNYCGTHSGRFVDKFKECGLVTVPAKKVKPPVIDKCIANIECRVVKSIPAGDHTIFIGEVLAAYAEKDLFGEEGWKLDKAKVLMHVGGSCYTEPSKELRPSK